MSPCEYIEAFVTGKEKDSEKQIKLCNTLDSWQSKFYQSDRMRFHFTSWKFAGLIARNGFRPSAIGMQGKGVYLTTLSPSKAIDGVAWPSVAWRDKLLQASHHSHGEASGARTYSGGVVLCMRFGVGTCWGRDGVVFGVGRAVVPWCCPLDSPLVPAAGKLWCRLGQRIPTSAGQRGACLQGE